MGKMCPVAPVAQPEQNPKQMAADFEFTFAVLNTGLIESQAELQMKPSPIAGPYHAAGTGHIVPAFNITQGEVCCFEGTSGINMRLSQLK